MIVLNTWGNSEDEMIVFNTWGNSEDIVKRGQISPLATVFSKAGVAQLG